MSVVRGSGLHAASDRGEAGSEATLGSSLNQHQTSLNVRASLPAETAVADLNNARAILSALHEQLTDNPRGCIWFGGQGAKSDTLTAEILDAALVSVGRRIARAVEQLTPKPATCPFGFCNSARLLGRNPCPECPAARGCKNCGTQLIAGADPKSGMLHCVFCGQLEADSGEILKAGAATFEITELGRGALELSALDQQLDEGEALKEIERQRERYHDATGSWEDDL